MTDKEILAELKRSYEYLYDILENADFEQLDNEQKDRLRKAKNTTEDIFEEVFEATSENIHIKGQDNLIIAETPSVDYYDIENECGVGKDNVIIDGKEYEWWNDEEFLLK